MSTLFISVFFGLGVAGLAYSQIGRRVGYGNGQSVWMIVGIAFLLTTFFFYSLFAWVLHI